MLKTTLRNRLEKLERESATTKPEFLLDDRHLWRIAFDEPYQLLSDEEWLAKYDAKYPDV